KTVDRPQGCTEVVRDGIAERFQFFDRGIQLRSSFLDSTFEFLVHPFDFGLSRLEITLVLLPVRNVTDEKSQTFGGRIYTAFNPPFSLIVIVFEMDGPPFPHRFVQLFPENSSNRFRKRFPQILSY